MISLISSLFLMQFVAVYILRREHSSLMSSIKIFTKCDHIKFLLQTCIILPFIEESIFRSVIKTAIIGEYSKLINCVLFGLIHIINYVVIKHKKLILIQIILTTWLGYVLINFEYFWQSYLFHSLYNCVGIIYTYATVYYMPIDPPDVTTDDANEPDYHITTHYGPTRSVDDLELENYKAHIKITKYGDIKGSKIRTDPEFIKKLNTLYDFECDMRRKINESKITNIQEQE